MTIECYHGACPFHCTNEDPKDEGPFCFETDCRATPEQLALYEQQRAVYLAKDAEPTPPVGYTAEELERDNPYNQWMHERGDCDE